MHGGEKKSWCTICDKGFSSKYKLTTLGPRTTLIGGSHTGIAMDYFQFFVLFVLCCSWCSVCVVFVCFRSKWFTVAAYRRALHRQRITLPSGAERKSESWLEQVLSDMQSRTNLVTAVWYQGHRPDMPLHGCEMFCKRFCTMLRTDWVALTVIQAALHSPPSLAQEFQGRPAAIRNHFFKPCRLIFSCWFLDCFTQWFLQWPISTTACLSFTVHEQKRVMRYPWLNGQNMKSKCT